MGPKDIPQPEHIIANKIKIHEEEALAFEAARYEDGTGYRVRFSSKPKATVPPEQLALREAVQVAVVVTHFNSRLGQRVEWQHPRDFVTEGVEFKVQHDTPSAHPLHARARPCAGANAPS